ncbi:MAG TPA: chromate transporter [Clostridiaceae bacterium]|nr:chromate transporter [Clostridiaceae bacterium]
MIYLELFLGFLRVGCFAFGGAYAAIPLIRDIVLSYGWLTDDTLSYMIAVSESTPGPIMVNLATYVGSNQGGLLGALIATLAVVLPSFLIILMVMVVLKHVIKNTYVQAALKGLKPCMIGIILATGIFMTGESVLISPVPTLSPMAAKNITVLDSLDQAIDIRAANIAVILISALIGAKVLFKKKLSPITLIVISAFLGILFYGRG